MEFINQFGVLVLIFLDCDGLQRTFSTHLAKLAPGLPAFDHHFCGSWFEELADFVDGDEAGEDESDDGVGADTDEGYEDDGGQVGPLVQQNVPDKVNDWGSHNHKEHKQRDVHEDVVAKSVQ